MTGRVTEYGLGMRWIYPTEETGLRGSLPKRRPSWWTFSMLFLTHISSNYLYPNRAFKYDTKTCRLFLPTIHTYHLELKKLQVRVFFVD